VVAWLRFWNVAGQQVVLIEQVPVHLIEAAELTE
jgi:hypothetical protein